MPTTETIVGDPTQWEANPARTELPLDKLGIRVRTADWGDAAHELFLVRQLRGEIPADRHPPNRKPSIILKAMEEHDVSLAEAAQKLQMKVGLWQEEGGSVRRDMDFEGGFLQSVMSQVYTAELGGIDGWFMAHRQIADEVTLQLETAPTWYGVNEREIVTVTEEANRELIQTIANFPGSAPGLWRSRIKNLNAGVLHWNGLIEAIESRDYPGAATANTTAALAYDPQKLTLLGGSANAEEGGVKYVRNENITNGWLTVLGSEIAGVGHMTHVGTRRMLMRLATSVAAEARLEYRPLGAPQWTTNDPVTIPVFGTATYQICDLGEVRLDRAILGSQRWEWRLAVKTITPIIAGAVRVQRIWPIPAEQMIRVSSPPVPLRANTLNAKNPETGENSAAEGGTINWVNPGNIKASDNAYATFTPTPGNYLSNYLVAKKFGFAIPGAATIVGIAAVIERKCSVAASMRDAKVNIMKSGVIKSEAAAERLKLTIWPTVDTYESYGGESDLWNQTWTPAQINEEGFGIALQAFGGPLGPVGSVDHIRITVFYTESTDENKVCFAQRSMEVRSEAVVRQHLTDDIWGKVAPEAGTYPTTPPSGLEKRPARSIIIPTQGDFNTQADAAATANKLSRQLLFHPGYQFTSEAGASSYLELFVKRAKELEAAYLVAPDEVADALVNLGNVAGISNGELKNGALMSATGLMAGGVSISLDGVNDYMEGSWETRINLLSQPSPEVANTQWTFAGGPFTNASTVTRDIATPQFDGVACLKCVTTAAAELEGFQAALGANLTVGKKYTASAYVKGNAGGEKVQICIGSAAVGNSVSAAVELKAGEWKRISVTHTATGTGAAGVAIRVPAGEGKKAITFFADCFLAEESETLKPFFPLVAEIASGLSAFSGTAWESLSDTGPLPRKAARTLVGVAQRTSTADFDTLFSSSGSGNPSLYLMKNQDIKLFIDASNSVTWAGAWTPGDGKTGTWAIVFNAASTVATLYVNGVNKGEKALGFPYENTPGTLRFGNGLPGNILPVAAFLKVLTEEQVQSLYF